MSDNQKACQATPAATLEAYIMGTGPKNEQEHWACGEIARLRAALEALKPYAVHRVGCEFLRGCVVCGLRAEHPVHGELSFPHVFEAWPCTCGLVALLKEEL